VRTQLWVTVLDEFFKRLQKSKDLSPRSGARRTRVRRGILPSKGQYPCRRAISSGLLSQGHHLGSALVQTQE
jgi:hypothetical protein